MADEIKTPISDADAEKVDGGAGAWWEYAKGTYVLNGNYVIYTIAAGDALSGIAIRFGVTPQDIQMWNPGKIKNINVIIAGQQLIIYYKILR